MISTTSSLKNLITKIRPLRHYNNNNNRPCFIFKNNVEWNHKSRLLASLVTTTTNTYNKNDNKFFPSLLLLTAAGLTLTTMTTENNNKVQTQPNNKSFNFVADAVDVASPALVHVATIHQTMFGILGSGGSGFICHDDGFVATNAHVVAHSEGAKLTVTIADGAEVDGVVWAVDRATDLALIKIDLPPNSTAKAAKIGSSSKLRVGEWVAALGAPMNLQNTITVGVVSSTARHANELGLPNRAYDFIQTDAAINTGNSGGPLINMNGEVVGINTMKAAGPEGISFSIPIDVAWPVLEQLREFKKVRRPYLGLRMVTIDAQVLAMEQKRTLKQFPTDVTEGVLVVQVATGSPADRGGVRPGDIVVAVDGKPVKASDQIIHALGYEVGKQLEFTIRRAKDKLKIVVTSEAMPITQI
jgi:HtrA serine peptidase 2